MVAALLGSTATACTGDDDSQPAQPTRVTLDVPVKAEPTGEPVVLESSVFIPSGSNRFPAVILGHGFGGTVDGMADRARALAGRGYLVLTYSARGFGRSGGRIHLNSPDYEIADITALVDALGKRPDVLTDSPGDPRVALVGSSYAGASSLMTAGTDPRIDAVVASATWNDLASVFYADATVPAEKVVRPGQPLPTRTASETASPGGAASTAAGAAASSGNAATSAVPPGAGVATTSTASASSAVPTATPTPSPTDSATRTVPQPAPADSLAVFKRRWASLFFSAAVQSAAAVAGQRPGPAGAGAPTGTSGAARTAAGTDPQPVATGTSSSAGVPRGSATSRRSRRGSPPPATSRAQTTTPTSPVECGRFDLTLCRQFLDAAASGSPSSKLLAELRRNSPAPTMSQVKAPTLLVQGLQDSLFGLDQADATAQALMAAQVPVAVRWYEGGHDGGAEPADAETVYPWLARYLTDTGRQSGLGLPVPAFTAPVSTTQRGAQPAVITTNAYPGITPYGRLLGSKSAAAPVGTGAPGGTPAGSATPTSGAAASPSVPTAAGSGAPTAAVPDAATGGVSPAEAGAEAPDPWTGTSLVDLHPAGTSQAPLLSPPGGDPAAVTSIPGLDRVADSQGGPAGAGAGLGSGVYPLAALPGQSVAFDTGALTDGRTLVGSAQVTLTVTSSAKDAVLFVSLWRLTPSGPVLPRRLVSPVRITTTPAKPTQVTVALPAGTYPMEEGSRWRVLVSATDSGFAGPMDARFYSVSVADNGKLVIPTGRAEAPIDEAVDREVAALLVVLGLVALLTAAGAWYLLRRRRLTDRQAVRDDLRDTPLVVDGLTKSYRDDERAVDEASWSALRGQVVGLLGPNGSGKTTTMRMLTGLIRPDAGTVHVLGEPVHAGSPVLRHVGTLIDDPGFLPHLTGTQNLRAYWQATGRGLEEAHLEEALEVAGLGDAVSRPVRTYSHGMRQRLGIAQAMLGRPELLLLDEPTNGLDPSQIATMRTVLREYAATDRAVVISSHLLSEVEQSCSHVVVMDRGRVVTTGAVADLVAGPDTTVVSLADGVDILTVAARLREGMGDRVREVTVDESRRSLTISADAPRPAVVAEVVAAGGPVIAVADRRRLEEVFLGVVGRHDPVGHEQGAAR